MPSAFLFDVQPVHGIVYSADNNTSHTIPSTEYRISLDRKWFGIVIKWVHFYSCKRIIPLTAQHVVYCNASV